MDEWIQDVSPSFQNGIEKKSSSLHTTISISNCIEGEWLSLKKNVNRNIKCSFNVKKTFLFLDTHGLIFETSICYWQAQQVGMLPIQLQAWEIMTKG